MNLSDFPGAIYQAQCVLLAYEQDLLKAQDILKCADAEVEQAIAFNAELKNDSQRKAVRHELQSLEEYQSALIAVQKAEEKRDRLKIELELLRNQFSIHKLERREAIATMELHASQAA